jgi:hypothetical protein
VRETASREGHEIFTDELVRFAARAGDRQISALVEQLRGPLRVAVRGRDGVGRTTVAAALNEAGFVAGDDDVDVSVVVVAEAVKPEDRAMLNPVSLLVLNKADLAGFGAGGPIAVADRRAAELQAATGVPAVPMVGLLAAAHLDDDLTAALHLLTTEPADLTSVDGFLAAEHGVPRDVRARLLDELDLFGIAHCVLALRDGADAAALPGLLRRLSQLDRVLGRLAAVGAEARYRRVRAALTTLSAMAAGGSAAVADFLSADDTVIATMAAAVDVVVAAGLTVDDGDEPADHLRRAVHWHAYGRGPVSRLHGRCAGDIRRGSLRLLRRAEGR